MVVRASPSTTDLRARVDELVSTIAAKAPPSQHISLEDSGVENWETLKRLGSELGLDRVQPEEVEGCFKQVVTTELFMVDKSRLQDEDQLITTMGKFTFNAFKPVDLEVDVGPAVSAAGQRATGLPGPYRGPYDDLPRAHVSFVHFSIVQEGGLEPLLGILITVAEWSLSGPDQQQQQQQQQQPQEEEDKGPARFDRLGLRFHKLKIEPSPSVAQDPAKLARWLALLRPHNATMDPTSGVAEVLLPPGGPVGFMRVALMDHHLQVYVGNRGSHMVHRRWQPPEGSRGAKLLKLLE